MLIKRILAELPPVITMKRVVAIEDDRFNNWTIFFLDGSTMDIHKTECEKDGFSISDAKNSLCNYEIDSFRERMKYDAD